MNNYGIKSIPSFTDHSDQTNKLTDSHQSNDRELWDKFRIGDESAFIQIYNSYANILFNYGCQFTQDRELVKDSLHDFFIYLRKNRTGFNSTDSIKFYLLKSFKRVILRNVKKSIKESKINQEFGFLQFPVELSSETMLINKQFEDSQIVKLNIALSELKQKEREAIYYFYYEGLSYEQIASIFGFTHVASGRRLIYTALINLRKFFPQMALIYTLSFFNL